MAGERKSQVENAVAKLANPMSIRSVKLLHLVQDLLMVFNRVFQKNKSFFKNFGNPGGHVCVQYQANKKIILSLPPISPICKRFLFWPRNQIFFIIYALFVCIYSNIPYLELEPRYSFLHNVQCPILNVR